MKVLVLFGLLLATVTGTEIIVGKCPDVPVVENFQAANYLGLWYEYSKYSQVFESGSCSTATYSLNTNGSVKVVNQEKEANGNIRSLEGYATFAGKSDEAKLVVKFPVTPVAAPYWVLDTDYKTYAVVFSCNDFVGLVNVRSVWVLTRERSPSEEVVHKALAVLKSNKLSVDDLILTNQANCD